MAQSFILLSDWKAYIPFQPTLESIKKLLEETSSLKKEHYLSLPYPYLLEENNSLSSLQATLGVQDMNSVESDSFTETISIKLLQEIKAQFVLLGNSLKRFQLDESFSSINKKIQSALEANIQPFLCVGETLKDFQEGRTAEVIKLQLQGTLKDFSPEIIKKITLVYDSPSSIVNKPNTTFEDINEMKDRFRQIFQEVWDDSLFNNLKILYPFFGDITSIPQIIENTELSGLYFIPN